MNSQSHINHKNNKLYLWMHRHTLRLLERLERCCLQSCFPFNVFRWWQHLQFRLTTSGVPLPPRFLLLLCSLVFVSLFYFHFVFVASHDCVLIVAKVSSLLWDGWYCMVDFHQVTYAPPWWGKKRKGIP